jgi:hypothetical protein
VNPLLAYSITCVVNYSLNLVLFFLDILQLLSVILLKVLNLYSRFEDLMFLSNGLGSVLSRLSILYFDDIL